MHTVTWPKLGKGNISLKEVDTQAILMDQPTSRSNPLLWAMSLLFVGMLGVGIYFLLRALLPMQSTPSPSPSSPSGNSFPPQTALIRVVNSCTQDLWIEARATVQSPSATCNGQPCDPDNGVFSTNASDWIAGAPIPNYTTPTKIAPGGYTDIPTPPYGLAGVRLWPKWGCDETGNNCQTGGQAQIWKGWDNPNGGCQTGGCSPPLDSMVEYTTACTLTDQTKCAPNPSNFAEKLGPITWLDSSAVNGVTLPYTITPVGDASQCNCTSGKCLGLSVIDVSKINLSGCPTAEDMTLGGLYASVTDTQNNNTVYPLSGVDLRYLSPDGTQVLGCWAPETKLTYGWSQNPNNRGFNQSISPPGSGDPRPLSLPAVWFNCPVPGVYTCDAANAGQPCTGAPDAGTCQSTGICTGCTPDNACVPSQACRLGPSNSPSGASAANSGYVVWIHKATDNKIYAWPFDDALGLQTCPGSVKYIIEFCPKGGVAYPAASVG